jgi:flagellar biosynthesis protein FlhG
VVSGPWGGAETFGAAETAFTFPTTPIVAIGSGKGGVGKTNLAASLSVALARKGARVLAIDGSFVSGGLDYLLGVASRHTVYHLLQGLAGLDEILSEGMGSVRVLPAATTAPEMSELDDFRRERILRSLSALDGSLDLILLDLPSGLGRSVLSLALRAQRLLLLTTPEPTACAEAYAFLKTLDRKRYRTRAALVVNMAANADQADETLEHLLRVSRHYLGAPPENWGAIPWDSAVPEAVFRQEPFFAGDPFAPASRAVARIAERLWGEIGAGDSGEGALSVRPGVESKAG